MASARTSWSHPEAATSGFLRKSGASATLPTTACRTSRNAPVAAPAAAHAAPSRPRSIPTSARGSPRARKPRSHAKSAGSAAIPVSLQAQAANTAAAVPAIRAGVVPAACESTARSTNPVASASPRFAIPLATSTVTGWTPNSAAAAKAPSREPVARSETR